MHRYETVAAVISAQSESLGIIFLRSAYLHFVNFPHSAPNVSPHSRDLGLANPVASSPAGVRHSKESQTPNSSSSGMAEVGLSRGASLTGKNTFLPWALPERITVESEDDRGLKENIRQAEPFGLRILCWQGAPSALPLPPVIY